MPERGVRALVRARFSSWTLVAGCVVVAALPLLVGGGLWRAGYSPDEEYTVFAVRGIHQHGLPLLPSGLLYDRGLAYSYAAWLAEPLAGSGHADALIGGRLVSVACAIATLALLAREVARMSSPAAAGLAVALVATSLPFWVSATTARFYAPFLLGYLACLALMARDGDRWRRLALLAIVAGLTRWTHELAFTLAGVPVLAFVVATPDRRGTWLRRAAAVIVGLVAAQMAIFAVHAAAPPSNGDVMVKRFFLWQVLNLFEHPPLDLPRTLPAAAAIGGATAIALAIVRIRQDVASGLVVAATGLAAALGQLGLGPFAALLLLPVVPERWRRTLVGTSLVVLLGAGTFWLIALGAAGLGIAEAAERILSSGVIYPLDMFTYLVDASPWMTGLGLAVLLARGAGLGAPWTAPERALHALWLGWVAWFGVIESGITARYLLLPVTFLLSAIAVDGVALLRAVPARGRRVAAVAAAVLAVVVTVESWAGPRWQEARADDARPTLDAVPLVTDLQPDDLVVSHDELGALLVAGRLDAWLVLDPFFAERFIVQRGGQPTGTYTGVPAASELTPLVERAEREHRRLIVVDLLHDVPGFGWTGGLLPRQLARERLSGDVLSNGLGLRLVHVRRADETGVAALGGGRPSPLARAAVRH